MKDIGKAIATIAIWGGTAGLSYLFLGFGILSGLGAFLMVLGAILLTAALWKLKI
ncbi:MAG: hypothetical protein HYY55_01525 [Candidatus Niyogibacteria bacterium]|nr:MAG: hypothetical protein HYY55_01525 [Candidatus Niyogibacteria bacterium]